MQHIEQHFTGSDAVRDVVIGMADGLTVPFALAAGILEEPTPKRAIRSALTIGSSYVVGGMLPLAPYMLMHGSGRALGVSAAITLLALVVFGFVKGHFTGVPKLKGAVQTALVGSLAAGAACLIAKFIA